MKFEFKSPALILFLTVSFLSGCNDYEATVEADKEDNLIFSLDFPSRSVGNDITVSNLDPLENYFNEEKSVLLIAQRTQNHSISFDDYNGDTKNGYLFKYVWDGKEANPIEGEKTPNWEAGYNFKNLVGWDNPLNWTKVISNGALGSSYAFGALYYPIDNEQRSSIEEDQSTLDGLGKSNLLGAYHLTESLYERFRFRLYHLMACIRVTILVPAKTENDDPKNPGFDERNMKAYMLKMKKDFIIEWGDRSSEEPPILKDDESVSDRYNITMYPHPVTGNRDPFEIDLSYFGIEEPETDQVRAYTFTGLFPPQTLSNTDNILEFALMRSKTSNNVDTRYYWSTSQLIANLQVSPGIITNLVLYLPRTENNAILLRSEIIDWDQTDASFTLTPEN